MKTIATIVTGVTLGLLGSAPAFAVGGSFVCERSATVEVSQQVDGSFALKNIVTEYMRRWDAREVLEECQAYAAGQPYEISCLNGRRDWPEIIASVPDDYFGRSNESLAKVAREEKNEGNGYAEALDYCRFVGAIK